MIILLILSSCSKLLESHFPKQTVCKTHTYINNDISSYIRTHYPKEKNLRTGVVGIDLPENLSQSGNSFPQEINWTLASTLYQTNLFNIIELIDNQHWLGKREEFFRGNFKAITLARKNNFNFIVLAYLKDINKTKELQLYIKLIDSIKGITIWHVKTNISLSGKFNLFQSKIELTDLRGKIEKAINCSIRQVSSPNL
jgi:hypothetical protein